jgi:signal transduction histidine kinase
MSPFGTRAVGLSAAAFTDRAPHEIFPKRLAEMVSANYRRAAARGEAIAYEEYLAFETGERWWRTTLAPVLDASGRVGRLLGIAVDVTADRQAEIERVRRVTQAAVAPGAEVEAFVSAAAHDLRAPLRQIDFLRGELACADDATPDRTALLAMMETIVARTRRLIEDVLVYVDSARGPGEASDVDLGRLCREVVGVLDPDRRFEATTPEGVLRIEPLPLQIILRALVDNAFRHGARARVSVTAEPDREHAGAVAFTVADDGPGFPDPARAFDAPHFAGGSGYGLAVIRRIAEARGGRVAASNGGPLGGAAVRFTLPGAFVESWSEWSDPLGPAVAGPRS